MRKFANAASKWSGDGSFVGLEVSVQTLPAPTWTHFTLNLQKLKEILTLFMFSPFLTHSAAVACRFASFRPVKLSVAPLRAKCAATAAPIPLLAPVHFCKFISH